MRNTPAYLIPRKLEEMIRQKGRSGKAVILLGPRQTGKTTLVGKIAEYEEEVLILSGDDAIVRGQLETQNTELLKQIIGKSKTIIIDEAQRIKNIGLTLKIIIDQLKPQQVYVTGSSSLELANEVSEPLTGRKWQYMLYPISWGEFQGHFGFLDALKQLEQRLIFGSYPEVITRKGEEREILNEIAGSYLYKDLLTYKGIKKPEILEKLLRALALQIGSEVSYNELAGLVQVDKNTIQTYLELLEKAFVIFRLQPLSRNIRNEISTSRKIYFFDNGIRNALISNFNPLDMRNDTGALWENYLICERKKVLEYERIQSNTYFWRTTYQQEIDYIEERDGTFHAYQFKWNPAKKARIPHKFLLSYPGSKARVISRDNFHEFL